MTIERLKPGDTVAITGVVIDEKDSSIGPYRRRDGDGTFVRVRCLGTASSERIVDVLAPDVTVVRPIAEEVRRTRDSLQRLVVKFRDEGNDDRAEAYSVAVASLNRILKDQA